MAAPYDTPVPGVAEYGQSALAAKTAYENMLARLTQRRRQTLHQYGYNGDVDPTSGVITNIRVDPFNQYGGLQEMLNQQSAEDDQAAYAAQDRGLHGGLAHKAVTALRHSHGGQSAALGSELLGTLGDYQDQQDQAKYEMDAALWQAEQAAARAAIENQQFSPANPTGDGEGDVGYGEDPLAKPPVTPPTVKPVKPTVKFGGKNVTRDQLIRLLTARKVMPSDWARNHPAAATKLGISPKLNANNQIIKQALKRKGR